MSDERRLVHPTALSAFVALSERLLWPCFYLAAAAAESGMN
jgi:hypothetical protein